VSQSKVNHTPTVLVVGDFMWDHYLIGICERVSPEAPIPIVKIIRSFTLPGGAGNVDRNLKSLGVDSRVLSGYGPDGTQIIKNRLMVGDHNVARWDEDYEYSTVRIDEPVEADALVISDYLKGSIDPTTILQLAQLNLPTYVDTKRDPRWFRNFRDVTIFPNLKEYTQYREGYDSFERCVLKKSAEGMVMLEYGKEIRHIPSMARYVRSVNGAGDSVIAGYVTATLQGREPMHYAAWCAAMAVEQSYTAVPKVDLKDEFKYMKEDPLYAA
jgi:bifunctional ADP-heptose synthase (sugar kinase/adenylyltransferase)